MQSEQILVFHAFRLDLVNAQLWRGQELIALRPKPFALLRYLAEHPGRLVTKDELTAAVWPGTYVGESSLKGYIRDVREVLGDDPEAPQFIETVARRGYRWIAAVQSSEFAVQSPNSQPAPSPQSPPPNLVGRERELEQLQRWYAKALRGERQVVFVTGEPGIGKTTLVDAFLARLAATDTLWIERGQCVEQYGLGEAYLPVLEAMGHSCRRPGAERTIDLLRRYAPTWLVQMPSLLPDAEFEGLQRKVQGATRERMLREMAEALEVMTATQCSVLVLEDLQWGDPSTLDLLSHVAQRREAARLLVIGTYRPTDVILSGHPLKALKQDLQGRRLCEEAALGSLSHAAVSQYLTVRFPHHQFPGELSQFIYRSTEGNPLFMVNIADYLEAQGLVSEVEGRWRLEADLKAVNLEVPESLRQMLERQIERLTIEEQRMLAVASVAGAEFSGAAVAAGLGETVERIEGWCEDLVRRGHFLRSHGTEVLSGGTVTGRYGFLHALYQNALYQRLAATQRIRLHRRLGEYLEGTSGDRAGAVAAELAMHFERGQEYQKAVQYLQQAAENAMRRAAPQEALQHVTKAVTLLQTLPDTQERTQRELALHLMQGALLIAAQGYAAPEVGQTYTRARELCQQVGQPAQLLHALWGLYAFHMMRAEVETAQDLGGEIYTLVQTVSDPVLVVEAYLALGATAFHRGEFEQAREYLACGTAVPSPPLQTYSLTQSAQDPWVFCLGYEASALSLLGYPAQARERLEQALRRVQALAHPFSLVTYHEFCCDTACCRREPQVAAEHAEAMVALATEHGFQQRLAIGQICQGWALAEQQQAEEGIAQIRRGLAAYQAAGISLMLPYFLGFLAEAALRGQQITEGLAAVTEALERTQRTGERFYEAELYRLKGELLLVQGDKEESQKAKVKAQKAKVPNPISQIPDPNSEAGACFLKAVEIARHQSAKLLELRATVSLSRLWQQQSKKKKEAHKLLKDIYCWFTEGFDTKDLQEAKALLDSLESGV